MHLTATLSRADVHFTYFFLVDLHFTCHGRFTTFYSNPPTQIIYISRLLTKSTLLPDKTHIPEENLHIHVATCLFHIQYGHGMSTTEFNNTRWYEQSCQQKVQFLPNLRLISIRYSLFEASRWINSSSSQTDKYTLIYILESSRKSMNEFQPRVLSLWSISTLQEKNFRFKKLLATKIVL